MDASAVIAATKWIGIRLIEQRNYLNDVKDQVGRLQDELLSMLGLLEESDQAQQQQAECHQEVDQQIAVFTKKIQQIAFRAEDVIDTYILQVASKSAGQLLLNRGACFLVNSPVIYHTRNQIDAITEEAKEANARLNRYRVVRTSTNDTTRSRAIMLETSAHIEDEIIVGFDDHVQTLVEQLTNTNKSWVIGIIGTGGAGKSTLARQVFRHLDVTCYFKYKAWVSISQQWNRKDVLYEILRKTRGINDESERNSNWSEIELVEMIYDFLKDQPYLLVLDDTWETKAWDDIHDALPSHNKGSKIIITSRILQVPSYADPNCFVLEPRLLHDEESWVLFRKIAIDGRNATSDDIALFENLGKEMVAKCGDLPLAVVTLAGLLRAQQSPGDWEFINKACGDTLSEYLYGRVNKIIALSYQSLPYHLKPCFLYLGVFSEDVVIRMSLLTQLWIAEGLVTEDQQREQETLEDVAKRNLDELVRRCILQVARRNLAGVAKWYRLHDLLRDFCVAKAKDERFLEVFSAMDQSTLDTKASSFQARRATFHSRISLPTQNLHLRSLIRFGKPGPYHFNIDSYEKVRMSMNPIYRNFKLLRVLNLWGIETLSGKLSKGIGKMINLRYLAIKATNFQMFPSTIGNLRNLLTLDLKDNVGEGKIAFTVSNMSQLRHLYLDRHDEVLAENFGLDKLKNLQILKGINAGNWMVKEMYALSKGINKLLIRKVSSMEQLEAMYNCPCIMFDTLPSLFLDWLDDEKLKLDLKKLENCQHLSHLTLFGRINEDNLVAKPLRFPPNIVRLAVQKCHLQRQDSITALGQLPYLKFLRLGINSYKGAQLDVGAYAFPLLEVLMLYGLPKLEGWRIDECSFACLKKLRIGFCPKLQRLPKGLKTISTLQELSVIGMLPTFCKRLGWQEGDGKEDLTIRNTPHRSTKDGSGSKRRLGEDVHIIQHIPTIKIWNVESVDLKSVWH